MANKKITALPALGATPATDDVLPIVDVSGTATTKKVTVANLVAAAPQGDLLASNNLSDVANAGTSRTNLGLGTAATSASTDFSSAFFTTVAETTTARTLSDSDNGKVIVCSNSGQITVTIPSGLTSGFGCTIVQNGTGVVSIVGSGATVYGFGNKTATAGQYGLINVYNTGTNTYVLEGDTQSPPFVNTYSVDFDGTDDYVDINSSGDVGTISIWFKPATTTTSASAARTLIGLTGISPYAGYGGIYLGNTWGGSSNDTYGYFDGDWGYYHSSSSTSLSNTAWHHLVIHWSGTDYELYLNGGSNSKNAEQNYVGATKAKRPYSSLKIAKVNAGSQLEHEGLIDEVAIWHNPLSSSELSGLYNGGSPTDLTAIGNSGAGPNGWWRMGDNNSGSGTTITDQGSGGNDGTLTNGPTFSTDVPS